MTEKYIFLKTMLREERRGLIIEVKSERNLDINNFDNTQKVNYVVV